MDHLADDLQPGTRVRMVAMADDPDPVAPGTPGTVTRVHRMTTPMPASRSVWVGRRPVQTGLPAPDVAVQVSVDWDDGRTLMVLLPGDHIEVVNDVG